MKIHREGHKTILILFLVLLIINILTFYFLFIKWVFYPILILSAILMAIIIRFFRIPARTRMRGDNLVIAPADGKIVAKEEVFENEYFNDKRIQLSIFMSPHVPHINWCPITGNVKYYNYQKGAHHAAFHPKSSMENEMSTFVIEGEYNEYEIMCRQIAGAIARRIVTYCKTGDHVEQSRQIGFIKFGSRVDILLPLDAKVILNMDDPVFGSQTILAELPHE
ncbi:MAG: phosphatidylserine decarboxylase family protein [Flavobacteriales bacterium]